MVPASVGHQCPECVREGRKHERKVTLSAARPLATFAVIGICIAMFVITRFGDPVELYRYGESFGPAVAAGDWWRLLTPMFLHANLFHIGLNMFALYLYGPGLERVFGTARFVGLFLASGFLGTAVSLFIHPRGLSVGASGAVFGILGAWGLYFYRRRTDPRADQMMRGIFGLIAINLLIGFSFRGVIDVWAHIGGLVGGAVFAFAADDAIGNRSKRSATLWSIAGLSAVVILGLALVMIKVSPLPACRLLEQPSLSGCRRVFGL
jgi:membrane associated rhomboid family serine protease